MVTPLRDRYLLPSTRCKGSFILKYNEESSFSSLHSFFFVKVIFRSVTILLKSLCLTIEI